MTAYSAWMDFPLWPVLLFAGAAMQALSLLPCWKLRRIRLWLVALGGGMVLAAAQHDQDHQLLIGQLVVWVWLWRGISRRRA